MKDIFVAVGFLCPLFAIVAWLLVAKRRYHEQGSEPFTELPLRPPGESLRLHIEKLEGEFDEVLLTMMLTATISIGMVMGNPRIGFFAGPICLMVYGWCGWRIRRLAIKLWPLRLGLKGERAVGEELNQLMRLGFLVFHDVPFGTFNLDHVIVGPPGVYVVETKTRRKPRDLVGRSKATVIFDGGALWFPKYTDRAGLEQARRNAETLSTWLSEGTAETVKVRAILTLPGWFVERKAKGEVNVLNPDEIKNAFPTRPTHPLTPLQIQRIAFQLAERSRSGGGKRE